MPDGYQNTVSSATIKPDVLSESPKRILITRNHSLTGIQAGVIIGLLGFILGLIGIWFYSLGAWLILPFAGLEFVALVTGFYVCIRHNNDYELVEIDKRNIHVRRHIANHEQDFNFQTYWTKILLEITEGWYPSRLWMQSKGQQVELGCWLTDQERIQLAHRLKSFI